ncbi:hypothetical protein [Azotobacter chroococcum]|uniref:Uncharacterized protein n=2 Tax=Azotobacter TaxID=352 RepID=A0A0C4WSW3_9GAMM|nr:hypothetical protein [Azotobacter chroococcum]AJE23806.1 Hypothetical protein Achr_f1110 [Azotobacter chroococcum NCIMB 8003]
MTKPYNDDAHIKTAENGASSSDTAEKGNLIMKDSVYVVRSVPYWVAPPEPHETFRDIEWGVMEVLSDNTLRFVRKPPNKRDLEKLIQHLESQC